MHKFYETHASKATKAFMTRLTEYIENEKFAEDLYNKGIDMEANDPAINHISQFDGVFGNRLLRIMTVSADLGNEDAIEWLSENRLFVTLVLAEHLEIATYELFMDRVNLEKNAHSLCMLGVINNVCNNPTFWNIANSGKNTQLNYINEEKKLAKKYYIEAGEKGNPQGFLNLAYMLYDDDVMDDDYAENLKQVRLWIHLAERLGGKDTVLVGKI